MEEEGSILGAGGSDDGVRVGGGFCVKQRQDSFMVCVQLY